MIPAFAVERTQELVTDLIALMDDGGAPAAPIFLDSPLAIRASEVFFKRGFNARGENPFSGMRGSSLFHTTESVDESKALERLDGWHIIIAASGMCDAGRIETPEIDDGFRLTAAAAELAGDQAPRIAAGAATQPDWHNLRSRLLLDLDEALETAPDDGARQSILNGLIARL